MDTTVWTPLRSIMAPQPRWQETRPQSSGETLPQPPPANSGFPQECLSPTSTLPWVLDPTACTTTASGLCWAWAAVPSSFASENSSEDRWVTPALSWTHSATAASAVTASRTAMCSSTRTARPRPPPRPITLNHRPRTQTSRGPCRNACRPMSDCRRWTEDRGIQWWVWPKGITPHPPDKNQEAVQAHLARQFNFTLLTFFDICGYLSFVQILFTALRSLTVFRSLDYPPNALNVWAKTFSKQPCATVTSLANTERHKKQNQCPCCSSSNIETALNEWPPRRMHSNIAQMRRVDEGYTPYHSSAPLEDNALLPLYIQAQLSKLYVRFLNASTTAS